MKKIAVLAATLGLSMAALTGCGAPKAQELVDKMNNFEMDSYTVNVYADIDMTAKVDGDKSSLTASFDVDAEVSDNVHAVVSYNVKADDDKENGKLEFYLEDGETAYFQIPGDSEWYSMDLEDGMDSLSDSYGVDVDASDINQKLVDKLTDASNEILYSAEVQKNTEKLEDGTECYVMKLTGTYADWAPVFDVMFDEMDEMEDLLDEMDLDKEDFIASMENIPVDITMYVSKADGYLAAVDYDFSATDVEGIVDSLGYDMDDLGLDSFEIKTFSYGCTFTNVNDTEVEIDDDVVDEATDITEMLGMLGGSYDYDYDYDYDDTDYDYSSSYGTLDICDYYGEYLYTAYLDAAGFSYVSDNIDSDGTVHYYTIEDDDDTTIYVNTWGGEVVLSNDADGSPFDDALKGYSYDESDYGIENYNLDLEPMDAEIEGHECYFVTETYEVDGDEYLWYYIVSPYTDSYGADEYLTFEIADNYYWDADTASQLISSMFY